MVKLREKNNDLTYNIEDLKSELKEKKYDEEKSKHKIETLNAEIQELKRNHSDSYDFSIQELKESVEMKALKKDIDELNLQIQNFKEEKKEALQKQSREHEAKLLELSQVFDEIYSNLKENENKLEKSEQIIKQLQSEKKALKKELETMDVIKTEKLEDYEGLLEKFNDEKRQNEVLQERIKEAKEQVNEKESLISQLQSAVMEVNGALEQKIQENKVISNEMEMNLKTIEVMQNTIFEKDFERRSVSSDLSLDGASFAPITGIKDPLDQIRDVLKDSMSKIASSLALNPSNLSSVEGIHQESTKIISSIDELQHQLQRLQDKMLSSDAQDRQKDKYIDELHSTNQKLTIQKQKLNENNLVLQERISSLSSENEQMNKQILQEKTEIREEQQEIINENKKYIQSLELEIETEQNKYKELESQIYDLNGQISYLNDEILIKTNQNEALQNEIDDLKISERSLESTIFQLESKIASNLTKQLIDNGEKDQISLETSKRILDLESQKAKLEDTNSKIQLKVNDLENQLESLKLEHTKKHAVWEAEKENTIEQLHSTIVEISLQNNDLEKSVNDLQILSREKESKLAKEISNWHQIISAKDDEIQQKQIQIDAAKLKLDTEIANAKSEKQELTKMLHQSAQDYKIELDSLNRALDESAKKKEVLQRQIEEGEIEFTNLQSIYTQLSNENRKNSQLISSLQSRLEKEKKLLSHRLENDRIGNKGGRIQDSLDIINQRLDHINELMSYLASK